MVDRPLVARHLASIGDAVARIREVLPPSVEVFLADRTMREVVVLNLFVALQDCLTLAAHCLSDHGLEVPSGYRELFRALADRGVIPSELASRLGQAAALRNLLAHRYGAVDWSRIHQIALTELGDLLEFSRLIARLDGAPANQVTQGN